MSNSSAAALRSRERFEAASPSMAVPVLRANAGAGDFEIGSNPRANHAMRSLEEYRHLIERAEATAVAHPLLYKIQLSLLATLGIGYVLVLVVVGVGLSLFVSGMLLAAKS